MGKRSQNKDPCLNLNEAYLEQIVISDKAVNVCDILSAISSKTRVSSINLSQAYSLNQILYVDTSEGNHSLMSLGEAKAFIHCVNRQGQQSQNSLQEKRLEPLSYELKYPASAIIQQLQKESIAALYKARTRPYSASSRTFWFLILHPLTRRIECCACNRNTAFYFHEHLCLDNRVDLHSESNNVWLNKLPVVPLASTLLFASFLDVINALRI
ncbi:hypothetical protein HPP92_029071 [Vanilla planifolia]|uniref:Uncharacterized protein n=1 Tax=Vanilla planifolia TaxID=51239 RepID=A0A835P8J7_VANPL|nr:hypothetical protein HPP92_029060 [Vanilla planifolia]KAG0445977.1 hypothetical protein HPP92_029071 [Vanilla planifolia]